MLTLHQPHLHNLTHCLYLKTLKGQFTLFLVLILQRDKEYLQW